MKKLFPQTKMLQEAKAQSKGHFFIIELLIFIVVLLVAEIISSLPVLAIEIVDMLSNERVMEAVRLMQSGDITYQEYTNMISETVKSGSVVLPSLFVTGIVTLVIFIYCRFIEKRKLSTLGFRKKDFIAEYSVGMLIGTLMFSAAVGICVFTGALSGGIADNIRWGMIGLFFVGFLIQGMSEEVMCRGYLMVSISRRSHIALAVALSSLVFGALHLGNNSFTVLAFINISLFGLFEALYILKRGNILGVCGIHSLWNFVQGNFYGISVSGFDEVDSVFKMSSVESKTLMNGGGFGLEGGLAVTIVLVICIVLITLTKTKYSELAEELPDAAEESVPAAAE